MRLLKEVSLFFSEGNSDKVYEISLLEVGAGECVVNFRYGRRGTLLRDGTKTIFPLPFSEAEKVYEKLLKEKMDKGYLPAGAAAQQSNSAGAIAELGEAQAQKVLEYLRLAAQGGWQQEHWKLSRLLWRAGELKLSAAAPYLLQLPRQNEENLLYSLVWALGRCATDLATERLQELRRHTDPKVARIATAALLKVGGQSAKESIYQELWGRLPSLLRSALEAGDLNDLTDGLEELLYGLGSTQLDFLFNLYLLADKFPLIRPALLEVLKELPYRPPFFQQIRYLLKASELLEDVETWGLINARIDKGAAYYARSSWGKGALVEGEYIKDVRKESQKADAKVAYSNRTRRYLQKRAIRQLNRMGVAGDLTFTAYARALLLNFSDADDRGPSQSFAYAYSEQHRGYESLPVHYPSFWEYPLLNVLLYWNSPRFEISNSQLKLRYRAGQQPGAPAPGQREEAFPTLWDAAPEELLLILQQTACRPVNAFAVKAFRANPRRTAYTSAALLKVLLQKPYPESHALGIELAGEVWNPQQPDLELLFALLNTGSEQGQALGLRWLKDIPRDMLKEESFMQRLLLVQQLRVQQWIKDQLAPHMFSSVEAMAITEGVLHEILLQKPSEQEQQAGNTFISQLADLLLLLFADAVKEVPLPLIEQLVAHRLEAVQALGVKILLRHRKRTEELPDALFEALLSSPFAPVRALGVELFGQLSSWALYDRRDVMISFCLSPHPEVRRQVIPIVAKLVQYRTAFGKELLELLLPLFWQKENYEGIHADLLSLFQQSLRPHFGQVPPERIWKLIGAKFRAAQLLGSELLQKQVSLDKLPLESIAALSAHELLEIRQLAWAYFEKHVERARYEREATLKLLDASWDDSLQFAITYIDKHFRSNDWTPALLLSVCDHKREQVQAFGLRLITQHFRQEDGVEYMIKLSQHPNTSLQLFVTNYLDQYAAGQPERIEAMAYYFTAVLSQVNRGRVAKERVYTFLRREALASEKVAAWLLPLLTRLSLTMAVGDKAHCIMLLTVLKERYPALESPVSIKALKTI